MLVCIYIYMSCGSILLAMCVYLSGNDLRGSENYMYTCVC